MSTFDLIASKIIKEQELIIGPIAWREAEKVPGIHITDAKSGTVTVDNDGNGPPIIDKLVEQYASLFGRASREASREAVAGILADLAPGDIPSSLRSA
jgi:hypothetical protein